MPASHKTPTKGIACLWDYVRARYLLLLDIAFMWGAIVLAFIIRYEALVSVGPYLWHNISLFVLVPLVRIPVYVHFRLHQRLWRFASTREFVIIVAAGVVSSILIVGLNFLVLPLIGITHCNSRSILILEGGISLAALAGSRFMLRLVQEHYTSRQSLTGLVNSSAPHRVLIAGAGSAGAMMLRELEQNPDVGMQAIGLVDDDRSKVGLRVHGVTVLGTRDDIPALVIEHEIDEVIIAMPTAPGKAIRAIKEICDRTPVRSRALPGVYELLSGAAVASQIRELRIEDLLRREPVRTDKTRIQTLLQGITVLVTGGGGSIGSEICRQVARIGPERLVLLGHGENSLFAISNELRAEYPDLDLAVIVADIRDRPRLDAVFARFQPAVVFHAAAHKHVPLMEANLEDAISNNVMGTRNLVECATEHDTTHLVMISSDKAVNPTSVMGVTKRVAELVVRKAALESGKRFVTVRFGNVLGSRGSVVPIFQRQIAEGGPVTVTHPEMKRYFMTIPEAVELVLQAAALGTGGEVFVLDMGDPIKIVDLARDLIELSGLQVGRDIEIEFTGMRPGEKLFEELFKADEEYALTAHERIFVCNSASTPLCEDMDDAGWQDLLDELFAHGREGDSAAARRILVKLVPEYDLGLQDNA